MHPSCLEVGELLRDCELRSDRRSGPGGQHRNKVETAIVIRHGPTNITAEASERRKQAENRRVAVFRLRLALAIGHRDRDQLECPSQLWLSRVRKQRLAVSAEHEDYPSLLAELLDFLDDRDYSLPPAAEHFGVPASQLVKLLRQYPPALAGVNAARAMRGMHKLS